MRNWENLYKTYNERYKKAQKQMERIGLEMEQKFNLSQFRTAYAMEENSKLMQRHEGKRKVLNTMQDLVNNQKGYKVSLKQARRLSRAANEYNMKTLDENFHGIEMDLVRQGYDEKYINKKRKEFMKYSKFSYQDFLYGDEAKTESFWNQVREYAAMRLASDPTVGQMFFGSPE